ncbi:AIPR family protein [Thiocystis violacea]|uniref:AIPR family protein n=1 Tax=Thiocystis violacea TaxID=13725 RepID=UPI00190512A6|nr:AIPR family protein [Thiocystis violacea]
MARKRDLLKKLANQETVNTEIKSSLELPVQRARFAIMNNGVTIIARTLRATGNKFHIEDYRIVNGCQTSHVLFDNRASLDESVFIPLRLIATDDEEVTASIVKATNRQTEVKEEQLIALSDFQKKLEAYFLTYEPSQRLYYERRSRQYNAAPGGMEKTRIVTPAALIRGYASCFLGEPHRTTRTYRALLQQLGKSIFGPQDRLEPYYFAASAHYRIEYFFRNGVLDPKYKPARYHILMAARLLAQPAPVPRPNSNEMANYCAPLIATIWNAADAEALAKKAAQVVDETAGGDFHRDRIRTQPFTEEVKGRCLRD